MRLHKNYIYNVILFSFLLSASLSAQAGFIEYMNGLEFDASGSSAEVIGVDKNNPPVYCKIPESIYSGSQRCIVTRIKDNALAGCTSLISIDIPDCVSYIGRSAFENCKKLQSVKLPQRYNYFINNYSIQESTFSGCVNLKTIYLPSMVSDIKEYAFAGSGLSSIKIHHKIKSYDNAFLNCNNLDSVIIYSWDNMGGEWAGIDEQWCDNDFASETANPLTYARTLINGVKDPISTLRIAKEVKVIKKYVFNNSDVKQIIIPSSVSNIEDFAFNATKPYAIVSDKISPPNISETAFSDYSAILYVPEDAIPNYTSHDIWGRFTNVKPIPTDEELISLFPNECELYVGETENLSAFIFKPTGISMKITWSSSDETIATVENGLVTALKSGDVTIRASASGYYAKCHIKIKPQYLQIEPQSITLSSKDERRILRAILKPQNTPIQSVRWESEDKNIATVTREETWDHTDKCGNVTPISRGKTRIIATTEDGSNLSASCEVTVDIGVSVKQIKLISKSIEGYEGEQIQIEATVLPENANNKTLRWISHDENVATVDDNGLISLLKQGSAIITASATDGSGVSAECAVVVTTTTGINDILTDKSSYVKIFNLNGILVYEGIYAEANLTPNYYIVVGDGKSIKVKVK